MTEGTGRSMDPSLPGVSPRVQQLLKSISEGDRSTALALDALICAASETGWATLNDVAVRYRRSPWRPAP